MQLYCMQLYCGKRGYCTGSEWAMSAHAHMCTSRIPNEQCFVIDNTYITQIYNNQKKGKTTGLQLLSPLQFPKRARESASIKPSKSVKWVSVLLLSGAVGE